MKQGDFVAAFRLKSRGDAKNKNSQPIIVRINDDWVKNELLSSYFRKKNLNLTDLGFKVTARIYINERLTSTNREIFNRAAEAKKSNLVYRFFTRRGLVFIQRNENSQPSSVVHISDLDYLFPLPRSNVNRDRGHRSFPSQSKKPHTSTPPFVNGQNGQINHTAFNDNNIQPELHNGTTSNDIGNTPNQQSNRNGES